MAEIQMWVIIRLTTNDDGTRSETLHGSYMTAKYARRALKQTDPTYTVQYKIRPAKLSWPEGDEEVNA